MTDTPDRVLDFDVLRVIIARERKYGDRAVAVAVWRYMTGEEPPRAQRDV